MTEELKLVIEAVDNGSTKTVGDLRKSITTMRDALVDANKESEEYQKIINTIGTAQAKIAGVMDTTRNVIKYQTGSYYELNQELVRLRKEYKSLSEEERNNPLIGGAQLTRIQELDGQLKDLDATMGQYQRNVGHYQLALEALNKTYANQRQELSAMKSAMDNLDPSSKEYAQAFERAAKITHDLSERQELLKYSSKDLGDQLSNIRGIASNMAAGFSAVNAAMGLFGKESEDVQKAMLKVQQAMALVQGLQGMDGLIKRTKGLSISLGLVRKETVAETAAVQGATVAQKGLNAAMKANPIGAIIIALQALIGIWVLFKDKIIDALGGQEKMHNVLNKGIAVFKGVGNAVIQYVITPFKVLIDTTKTTINTLGSLIKLDFKGAWKNISDGVKKTGEDIKKGYSFASNFNQSYNATVAKQNEEARKKEAEARAKDLDNQIKDAEAKYGNDWKYTEDAKKLYTEYFDELAKTYAKDSEEYRELMRDKDTYNREFQANADKKAEEAKKKDDERNKKAAEDAKRRREEIAKNYKSLVTDFLDDELEKAKKQVQERWDAFTKAAVGDLATKTKLAQKTGEEIGDAFVNGILTKMARLQQDSEAKIAELKAEWERTQFEVNVKFPDDNLEKVKEVMDIQKKAIQSEVNALAEAKKALHDEMAKAYTDQGLEVDEDAIAGSEAMRQIENATKNAIARQKQAELDGLKEIDDIYREFYDRQIKAAETAAQIQADNDAMYFDKIVNNRRKALNGFTPEEEAESLNRSYELAQQNLERQKAIYQEMADNAEISAERRIEAEKKVDEITRQMQVNEVAHDRDIWEQKADAFNYYVDTVSNGIDRIGELFTSLADYYEADMEAQLKAGKITEAEADRQYENIKGMRIAEATINTIAGAIGAYLQAVAAYPPPAGEILGGISAAAVTAAGMAEIKKIKSTTRSGSGSGGSGISATATPSYEPYRPTYVENTTGASDTENLRNALMEQPIYVRVSDVDKAQQGRRVRISESSF